MRCFKYLDYHLFFSFMPCWHHECKVGCLLTGCVCLDVGLCGRHGHPWVSAFVCMTTLSLLVFKCFSLTRRWTVPHASFINRHHVMTVNKLILWICVQCHWSLYFKKKQGHFKSKFIADESRKRIDRARSFPTSSYCHSGVSNTHITWRFIQEGACLLFVRPCLHALRRFHANSALSDVAPIRTQHSTTRFWERFLHGPSLVLISVGKYLLKSPL